MVATKKKPSTAKKPAVKKRVPKKSSPQRSFASSSHPTFMEFRFTQQTLYWVIIGALVLALAVWVLSLTIQVQSIYDDIDRLRATDGVQAVPYKH